MSTLEKAISIATTAHASQKDKAGADYINHPLRVMSAGKTTDEKIVGVLHDVVEDSEWTFDLLKAEGFSMEILEALKCLTKLSDNEPYERFIDRVKSNPLAIKVKLNDLADNMDIRRLNELTNSDVIRLSKYMKAYRNLSACRCDFTLSP